MPEEAALQASRSRGEDIWRSLALTFGERRILPHFEGRHEIRREVLQCTQALDMGGSAYVFHGAPGAGKTALARQLIRDHVGADKDHRGELFMTGSADPAEMGSLLRLLPPLLNPSRPEPHTSSRGSNVAGHAGGQFSLPGVAKGEANLDYARSRGKETPSSQWPQSFPELVDEYRKAVSKSEDLARRRVIVCIDEAQRLTQESADLVVALHDDDLLPVTLVLSGTSDLVDVLDKIGISRPDPVKILSLSSLSDEESHRMVRENLSLACRDKGLDYAPDDDVVRFLAEDADGWPKHLANRLGAFCAAMAEHDARTPDRRVFDTARRNALALRENYYQARVNKASMAYPVMAAALHACDNAPDGNASPEQIRRTLYETVQTLDDYEKSTHLEEHGRSTGQWASTLAAAGILTRPSGKPSMFASSPIPSLKRFIRPRTARKIDAAVAGAASRRVTEGRRSPEEPERALRAETLATSSPSQS